MGEYLMPPALSNPDGHYEDMPLVALHDDLLERQGTNWQYSGEVDLSSSVGLEEIQRYVSLRKFLHGASFGMKDPRQCLFLRNWQEVLGDTGCYLVVLRHWSASIQSLLKRSSQDLALGMGSSCFDSRAWQEPGHAARVWLAYNKRLLEFLGSCHPDQCLVVTQQSLMQGLKLPSVIIKKFGLPINPATPSPIKSSLVHDDVAESVLSHMTNEQVKQMDMIWSRLLSFAEYRTINETPLWKPDSYSIRDRWLSRSILSASPSEGKSELSIPPKPTFNSIDAELESSFSVLSARSENAFRSLKLFEAEKHSRMAVDLYPNKASGYVRLAYIFLVLGRGEDADALLSYAIERLGDVTVLLVCRAMVLDSIGRTRDAIESLAGVESCSEILRQHRITLLLKSDCPSAPLKLSAWSRQQSTSMKAWQKVSQALKEIESQSLREDFALRVARVWNQYA